MYELKNITETIRIGKEKKKNRVRHQKSHPLSTKGKRMLSKRTRNKNQHRILFHKETLPRTRLPKNHRTNRTQKKRSKRKTIHHSKNH